eukprot:3999771-Prymnesium_polylepis.1
MTSRDADSALRRHGRWIDIRTHAMEPTAARDAMSFRARTRDGLHSGSAAPRGTDAKGST